MAAMKAINRAQNVFISLFFITTLSTFLTLPALAARNTRNIQKKIDQLINKVDPSVNIGIKVVRLADDTVLYERNAHRSYVPASNQKIYTDAAALLYLGPDYTFQTTLLSDAEHIKANGLQGNVYLKLDGDPSLTARDLDKLIRQLKSYHLKTIHGDFIIDPTVFADEPYGPGSSVGDIRYAYGAQKTPLIIDQNYITLIVNGASQVGGKAKVKIIPDNPYIQVINTAKTQTSKRHCQVNYHMKSDLRLLVNGCIHVGHKSVSKGIAIMDPVSYARAIIRKVLKSEGIRLIGKIKLGEAPQTAKRLAWHESPPLKDIVIETLKVSNNMYADAVFLKLGAVYFGKPGSWELAGEASTEILEKQAGLNFAHTKIVDGSGLSRYNLMTPDQMINLLSYMYANFPIAYEFVTSLPKSGIDGSLVKRMNDDFTSGWVRAKTGTMSGIVSLSGYLSTADQQVLAFTILVNGFTGSTRKYRALEDKICRYLTTVILNKKGMTPAQKRVSDQRKSKMKAYVPRFAYEPDVVLKRQADLQEVRLRKKVRASDINVERHQYDIRVLLPEEKLFLKNEMKLTKKYQKKLLAISRVITKQDHPLITIEVLNHKKAGEQKLQHQRVEVIAKFLAKHGVKRERILQIFSVANKASLRKELHKRGRYYMRIAIQNAS